MLAALNLDSIVKLAVLAILAPFWWPILKALYAEIQEALWREGGLFGRALGAAEVERLADEHRGRHTAESPLVSEPWSARVGTLAPRPARGRSSPPPQASTGQRARLRPEQRRPRRQWR